MASIGHRPIVVRKWKSPAVAARFGKALTYINDIEAIINEIKTQNRTTTPTELTAALDKNIFAQHALMFCLKALGICLENAVYWEARAPKKEVTLTPLEKNIKDLRNALIHHVFSLELGALDLPLMTAIGTEIDSVRRFVNLTTNQMLATELPVADQKVFHDFSRLQTQLKFNQVSPSGAPYTQLVFDATILFKGIFLPSTKNVVDDKLISSLNKESPRIRYLAVQNLLEMIVTLSKEFDGEIQAKVVDQLDGLTPSRNLATHENVEIPTLNVEKAAKSVWDLNEFFRGARHELGLEDKTYTDKAATARALVKPEIPTNVQGYRRVRDDGFGPPSPSSSPRPLLEEARDDGEEKDAEFVSAATSTTVVTQDTPSSNRVSVPISASLAFTHSSSSSLISAMLSSGSSSSLSVTSSTLSSSSTSIANSVAASPTLTGHGTRFKPKNNSQHTQKPAKKSGLEPMGGRDQTVLAAANPDSNTVVSSAAASSTTPGSSAVPNPSSLSSPQPKKNSPGAKVSAKRGVDPRMPLGIVGHGQAVSATTTKSASSSAISSTIPGDSSYLASTLSSSTTSSALGNNPHSFFPRSSSTTATTAAPAAANTDSNAASSSATSSTVPGSSAVSTSTSSSRVLGK